MSEQALLKLSIVITGIIAALGISIGLVSGSTAIMFEGVYSLADAFMTVLALLVTRLIAAAAAPAAKGRILDRFSVGFWHLEPMVLGLNGTLLMGAAGVALVGAVASLLDGGRAVEFGPALLFAAVATAISLAAGLFFKRANAELRSRFVDLDAKAWFMTAALASALLVAFFLGFVVTGTEMAWLVPYVDPAVLALACLFILPTPIANVWHAIADILLVAPAALRSDVDRVARLIVGKHGFKGYRAYVSRVGRLKQIELYFIAPADLPARTLHQWDAVRDEVGQLIGGEGSDRWLTIVFTADPEWAE